MNGSPAGGASSTATLRMLREGTLRPTDLVRRASALAQECQRECNAFPIVAHDLALSAAAESDERYGAGRPRALEGLPFAVKDMIDTAGVETRYGSRAFVGHVPPKDAEVVRRLRDAGAVVVGKTSTHEFAWGVTTGGEAFGPTRNPFDPDRIPGGSSGGTAAAVAYGAVRAGLGTDTGGSVRIPAALCGVVGFKPTFGTWSHGGVFPLAPSLDHVGLIGRTIDDVAVLSEALGLPRRNAASGGGRALVVDAPGGLLPEDGVGSRFADAVRSLRRTMDLRPSADALVPGELMPAFATIVLVEGGVTHFSRSDESRRRAYEPETLQRLELARTRTIADYAEAQEARRRFVALVDARLTEADFLVLPTTPRVAPLIGAEHLTIGGRRMTIREALMAYTAAFNMSGHPAITLPLPGADNELPAGLQIVGRRGEDHRLLRVAQDVEAALAGG